MGQHEAADKDRLSILRNLIGTDSVRIMYTLTIFKENVSDYNYILNLIDKYVTPKVNECFERYTFLKRTQKEDESFEHFLTVLPFIMNLHF